jgi:DeoR family glycerol-3-phosphate regulon repressor
MNARAKKAIAARAAAIIPDGATLFISIGTTPAIAAAALAEKPGLTVITNNLNAANALAIADAPGTRIVLPGGQLRLPDRDFLGEEAVRMFEAYRADFGLYGVGGIEADGALLDFEESEVRARERIRRNSRVSLLLADHTKFGRRATVAGGRIEDADCMIVDRLPGGPFRALLEGFPGRLILAEDMPPPGALPGRIPGAGSEAAPAPAGGSAADA